MILYQFGGIFFDTETILLKDFSPLYGKEYFYPFSYKLLVNNAVISLKKHSVNGSINSFLKKLFERSKKMKKNVSCNTFEAQNLINGISPNDEPNLNVLPLYLFDPTWYKRDMWDNPRIREQSDMDVPYWIPSRSAEKNGSYFMFINEKVSDEDWARIGGDIKNFLPYSLANHYHDEVLRDSNIVEGSWLDMYKKEFVSQIRTKMKC